MTNYTRVIYAYIQVQEIIQDLQLTGPTSLLWSPGTGNWSVSLGATQTWLMNITCVWTIGTNLATYVNFVPVLDSVTPHQQSYTFARADCGVQRISVNCSNSISWKSYSLNVNLVLDSVNVGTLVYNGPFYWNVTMTFSFSILRFGAGACFEWDMGDGTPHVIYQGPSGCTGSLTSQTVSYVNISATAQILNVPYTYDTFGIYTVNVRYFNHINDASLSMIANVWEWPCNTPTVTIDAMILNAKTPLVTTVNKGFTVNVTLNVSCMKNERLTLTWDLFILPQWKANPSVASLRTQVNGQLFTVAPFQLLKAVYVVRLKVSMYNHYFNLSNYDVTKYAYINLTQSALIASIQGGPFMSILFNFSLVLDAHIGTYDPDIPDPSNKTGMTILWECKQSNETWPSPMPILSTHLFSGQGGCFGDGPGIIENYTSLTISMDTSQFLPYRNYTLRVYIKKDVRQASNDLNFYINIPLAPTFQIGLVS